MELFDVQEWVPDRRRNLRGADVMIDEPFEIIVIDKWVGWIDLRSRIEDWIVDGDQRLTIAVAARMRQLQPDEKVVVIAAHLAMRVAADLQHLGQAGRGVVV